MNILNKKGSTGGLLTRNGSVLNSGTAGQDYKEIPRHLSLKEYEALRTFTQILVEKEEAGRNKG